MTIDKTVLNALGDNWMLTTSRGGAQSNRSWQVCAGKGAVGQGPGGFGYLQSGDKILFCATRSNSRDADRNKVYAKDIKVLYDNVDAINAASYKCGNMWPGSLDLRSICLPDYFRVPDVVGHIDLSGAVLPVGLVIGFVGGRLNLNSAKLASGLKIFDVKWLSLSNAVLPDDIYLGKIRLWANLTGAIVSAGCNFGGVDGSICLRHATLPDGMIIPYATSLDLSGATLPQTITIGRVVGDVDLQNISQIDSVEINLLGGRLLMDSGVSINRLKINRADDGLAIYDAIIHNEFLINVCDGDLRLLDVTLPEQARVAYLSGYAELENTKMEYFEYDCDIIDRLLARSVRANQ